MDHGVIYELFKHNTFWENLLIICLMMAVFSR